MTGALATLAVVAALVAVAVAVAWRRERSAGRARHAEAERRAAESEANLRAAEGRADAAEERARRAEQQAATAAASTDAARNEAAEADRACRCEVAARRDADASRRDAEDALAAASVELASASETRVAAEEAARQAAVEAAHLRAALDTLRDLGHLEQRWRARAEAEVSTAPRPPTTPDLRGVLSAQLDRTREETGTPGTLVAASGTDPGAALALLVARSVELLLSVAARRCDSYELRVETDPGSLAAGVVCEGYDGGSEVADDARALAAVLEGVGVTHRVQAGGGRLEVELRFPVPAGSYPHHSV